MFVLFRVISWIASVKSQIARDEVSTGSDSDRVAVATGAT